MSKAATIKASDLHVNDYANDLGYRKAYDDLEESYALISVLIRAHARHRSQTKPEPAASDT